MRHFAMLAIAKAYMLSSCAFEFKPSIEPLELPTAPAPAFQGSVQQEPSGVESIEGGVRDQAVSPQSLPENEPGFSALTLPLIGTGIGMFGALAAFTLSLANLKLATPGDACIGSVIAGVLGFVELVPVDGAVAFAAAELAGGGPAGVGLDLLI